ncbi:hypothetical protein GQ457_14G025230 [Hibiscus cannabinus]
MPLNHSSSTLRISTGSRWIDSSLRYVALLVVVSQTTVGSRRLTAGAPSPALVWFNGEGSGLEPPTSPPYSGSDDG